jgi:Protein of unknown function (DUF669)
MASLNMEFDPNAVEPGGNFDPVPAGEYVAQIVESDVAPPKSGNGLMLNLTWEITEGEYTSRKFWQRINYQHTSAQAQLIGQQQLKSICNAIGLSGHLNDSEELHFQPCLVRLSIDAKDSNYAPKNEVKSVKPASAQAPAAKPQTQQPTQGQATQRQAQPQQNTMTVKPAGSGGGSGNRPWGNRKAG